MKKFKTFIFSALLVLSIAVCPLMFVACGNKTAKAEVKNVFAMGMVSATNYLSSSKNNNSFVSDQTKDTIKEYVQMFEGLLQNGLNPVEKTPTDTDGEFKTYAKKLEISANAHTYTMYYNEVVEGTETKIDDGKIETETKSFLYGKVLATIDNESNVYNVVGTREIENETKKDVVETENEMELLFTSDALDVTTIRKFEDINLDSIENYVLIEQENESNEIEFEYTTKNGTNIKQVEIEFENKKILFHLKLKLKKMI